MRLEAQGAGRRAQGTGLRAQGAELSATIRDDKRPAEPAELAKLA